MVDRISTEKRSALMRSVRRRGTKPEMVVRRALHSRGWRYRLHRKSLPGSPDIVFPGRRKVIFVHGCFWHGHACRKGRLPTSNVEFWSEKIERNQERDARAIDDLSSIGWRSLVIWECELAQSDAAIARIEDFLVESE